MKKHRSIKGPVISIACYKPKPRKAKQLHKCVKDHLPILRSQKLVTARKSIAMLATDGTVVEVFEWKSEKAISAAHQNRQVLKLWQRFDACCTFAKFRDLAEAKSMFPGFTPLTS